MRCKVVAIALADVRVPGMMQQTLLDVRYPAAEYKAWCQMYVLHVLRRAGLTTATWRVGHGIAQLLRLRVTDTPSPGDVVYWHTPYQHAAIYVYGDERHILTVDGAQAGCMVLPVMRTTTPTAVYSIAPLLASEKKAPGS